MTSIVTVHLFVSPFYLFIFYDKKLFQRVLWFAEKARIEAQIKAAEVASRRREQDDLKMRRERERKAARMALQKVHFSIHFFSY